MTTRLYAFLILTHACVSLAWPQSRCRVSAMTDAGEVCGVERPAEDGFTYASFRGVPYAKQPVGELRFKELEPPEHWGTLDATTEGPACWQTDVVYERLMQAQGMSEACIHANIHVPMEFLPSAGHRLARELEPPTFPKEVTSAGLPILVFIHGGGFAFGSGDADLHGPEYLVSKKVIVITFNYRLNVFGFLSLNSSQVAGNAGLRDMVALLRWVQRNARAFGGDPRRVTLAGHSAGAAAAHLLALAPPAEPLFKSAILMSGTATSSFYTPSPVFAKVISNSLLGILGITATDPDEIHRQLIDMPAEKLNEANSILLDIFGLTTFVPTVEYPHPGVTAIVDDYPDVLLAKGRDSNIPLLIGYTSSECETFRNRLEKIDIVNRINDDHKIMVPPKTIFTTPPELLLDVSKKIDRQYYNGTISVDNFVKVCSDGFYEYPALKLAEVRAKSGGAPAYLYRFAYEGHSSAVKAGTGQRYRGVGHIEDLTYVFRPNALRAAPGATPRSPDDIGMSYLMTDFVVNFMTCSQPICDDPNSLWPAVNGHQFEDIQAPSKYQIKEISPRQQEIIKFFDSLTSTTGVK